MTMKTATILILSQDVREAIKNAKTIEHRMRLDGHEWSPALAAARSRFIQLAMPELNSPAVTCRICGEEGHIWQKCGND